MFGLVAYVVTALPMMGVFRKADQSPVAAFIPIWNLVVLLKIVGRPVWWIVLYLIPFVNVVIMIVVFIDLAASFGRGGGFAAGLIFLTWIFLMILWLGSDTYVGPGGRPRAAAA